MFYCGWSLLEGIINADRGELAAAARQQQRSQCEQHTWSINEAAVTYSSHRQSELGVTQMRSQITLNTVGVCGKRQMRAETKAMVRINEFPNHVWCISPDKVKGAIHISCFVGNIFIKFVEGGGCRQVEG